MATDSKRNTEDVQTCDICIIGAGAAGLNALFVASQYLGRNDRVILIERRDCPGGMWTDVYEYARLHQPHPSFTVGDMKWNLAKPADYLARGDEVAAHLRGCFEQIRDRVDLVELFGHTVTACDEIDAESGSMARVECHDEAGGRRVIEAKRVIKAIGFDVPTAAPLVLSSRNVVSTTPERLGREAGFDSRTAVYVVGGGKTGMDTAYKLIRETAGREVTLINGRGTVFAQREKYFPSGARRWWSGTLLATMFRDQSLMFDGLNEDACFEELCRTSLIGAGNRKELWFFGILSDEERRVIDLGLAGVFNDYLEDVVDGPSGPIMVFRSGARRKAPEGSVFVNCTGHLLRHDQPYEPYLSKGGAVLSINQRSMAHFLSTAGSYFLTHLFMRGALRSLPLYQLDGQALLGKSRRVYHTAAMSLTFMNQILMMRALPLKVFTDCGLDIDRLYPLHRRALALVDLKLKGASYVRHCMQALDRVREIHDVRCGPLCYDEAVHGNDRAMARREIVRAA